MSRNLDQSLHFTIQSSRLLTFTVIAIHLLAALSCWLAAMAISYKLMLLALVCFSWLLSGASAKTCPIFLRYTAQQDWCLCGMGGEYLPIRIRPSTVISRTLIVLHWTRAEKCIGNLVIFKDAMSPNDYRRLLVCLKISGCGQG